MNPLYLRWSLAGAVAIGSTAGLVYWLKPPSAVATASENTAAADKNAAPSDPLFGTPAENLWKGGRANDPFARNRSPGAAYPIERAPARDSSVREPWNSEASPRDDGERDNWDRQTKTRQSAANRSGRDPFAAGNRADGVLRTSYEAEEPARFDAGPNAKPLASTGSRPANRDAGARLTAADDEPTPAETQQPNDPFGLHPRNQGAASATSDEEVDSATSSSNTDDMTGSVLSGATRSNSPSSKSVKNNATSRNTAASKNRASSVSIAPDLGSAYGPPRGSASTRDSTDDGTEQPLDAISTFDASGRRTTPLRAQPAPLPSESPTVSSANSASKSHPFSTRATSTNSRAHSPTSNLTTNSPTTSPFSNVQQHEPNALLVAGTGRPGTRQAEGRQAPQLTIEKVAPPEIQIGKPAKIELVIRNTGTVAAQGVEVYDAVPEGTSFVESLPPTQPGLQGELTWTLGMLKPGDESKIELTILPTTEGEVGSVAMVTFRAEAGSRSRVTKPELTVQVTAAKQVMIGGEVALAIKIANPGTGPASNVVILERVPPGLKHPAGPELEFEVGTLKPGEQRELDLTLSAAQAGRLYNTLTARGDGNLAAEAQCEIEVIAPALEISMEGPARRYLERQATYTVSVTNPGTAPAKEVELVTHLPRGLKFVKANNAGQYDARSHSVAWSLEELPPAETGTVSLTAIPVEAGEQRLRAEGRARQGLADEQEQITVVEGLAALLFTVVDVADPIEVKGETTYEINITNQGSKAAENVRLAATLPPQMKFTSADGPTKHGIEGTNIVFEPLSRLAPKADTSYRITLRGESPGDVRMRVQLVCDDMREPVTKEESTRVYADE